MGPLRPAVGRLYAAENHLLSAAASYHEILHFTTSLNAAIQELRNITFILQSQKAVIPGFDGWYPACQDWMRSIPELCALTQARNEVVKRGDLTRESHVEARLFTDFSPERDLVYSSVADPLKETAGLAKDLAARFQVEHGKALEHSVFAINRTWILPMISKSEILIALSLCSTYLVAVILDCQKRLLQSDAEYCDEFGDVKALAHRLVKNSPPKNFPRQFKRRHFYVRDASPVRDQYHHSKHKISDLLSTPSPPKSKPPRSQPIPVLKCAETIMEDAKNLVRTRGHCPTMITIEKVPEFFEMIAPGYHDIGEEFVGVRFAAERAREVGAHTISFATESALYVGDPRQSLAKDRLIPHALFMTASAMNADGEEVHLISRVGDVGGKPIFGPIEHWNAQGLTVLEPLRDALRPVDSQSAKS